MVPPQNPNQSLNQAQNLHAPTYGAFPFNIFSQQNSFGLMSRFEGFNNHHHHHDSTNNSFHLQDESTAAPNTLTESPRDVVLQDPADKGWLRLSIGGGADYNDKHDAAAQSLDLLPGASRGGGGDGSKFELENEAFAARDFSPAEVNWTLTPISHNHNSSSCSSFVPFGPYYSRPFQLHAGIDLVAAAATAGPSSDTITVIDPPQRPHSGIWFTLQPLEFKQGKQPTLPHRSSSYLRIKDGRMTVRLLIKYLVKKLRLDSESQIEIMCRGEKLEPCLTMQHIRDNIWSSKHYSPHSHLTLLPHSSTIHHIMVLHYATPS